MEGENTKMNHKYNAIWKKTFILLLFITLSVQSVRDMMHLPLTDITGEYKRTCTA